MRLLYNCAGIFQTKNRKNRANYVFSMTVDCYLYQMKSLLMELNSIIFLYPQTSLSVVLSVTVWPHTNLLQCLLIISFF